MMLFGLVLPVLSMLSLVEADVHNATVCVKDRTWHQIGLGTPQSPSIRYVPHFTINNKATECACNYYRQRNTGDKHWDTCTDCKYVSSPSCFVSDTRVGFGSAGWAAGG
ncbi:hypothetical protein IAQ61_008292 [Plenodomus lingam]|uniref:uncharacterized protein n=1 Tax=Leptosphaeria maculans TaxID=5022 RepID=UPI00331C2CA7|nr:hypothetical protein IAQ61_008292 [Plenodomus lingam]